MTIRFFKNVNSLEELRRQYKTLIFKHHPDKGGKTEDMQQINAEYEELKKTVGNIHETADGRTYKAQNEPSDIPDNFRKIINAIINFECKIELCGKWIWVFNAYAYKQQLKDLGFFWCSTKKAWAWAETPNNNKHRLSLDEIRKIHGSEVIKDEQQKQLQAAI
jgi:hypothetical protein